MRVVRASRIRNPFIEQSCTVITLRTSLVVLVVPLPTLEEAPSTRSIWYDE
jgi:hypothetical protein